MVDELDIYDELPFSVEEGWAEMQALLNKKLPAKNNTARTLVFSFLQSLFLSVIFLLSSLQLSRDSLSLNVTWHEVYNSSTPDVPSFVPMYKEHPGINRSSGNIIVAKNKIEDVAIGNESKTGNEFNVAATVDVKERMHIENIIQHSHENKFSSVVKIIPVNTEPGSPMTIVPRTKNKLVKPWELSAGIGINMAAGNNKNLQPYPVAEIKYNLNKRLFIAAGLSLFSPAPGNVSGVNKTTYVNDTSNNIRLYNEVVKYDHLRYADLPLMLGMSINKKIYLQAGIQASFLLSKSEKKSLQPYDFQMNNIDRTDYLPLSGLAASPHEEFDVRVRNIDYRFITGIKYRYNKMTAGLFYQHGLQSTGIGNANGKSSNQLFTLNLLYKIKK